jgi:hypothetical protein
MRYRGVGRKAIMALYANIGSLTGVYYDRFIGYARR